MAKERAASAALRRLAPELLFVLLVLAVFADPLFLGRNFAGRDLLPYHLPMEHEIHDAWSRAVLPVWTSCISGGRPILANPNLGALYPVRPLLALLSFPAAFRIFPVFHWIVAGVGMMRLLRAVGRGRSAAWVGAVTYVFSGVGISEVFYTNIQPGMALLPWVLWAGARPVASRARRILPLAALFALDLLAGDVFTIGIAFASCALWIALEAPRASRGRESASLATAVVLAALFALPQILSSALWAPLSTRAISGIPLSVAAAFSISPWRLLEFLVPYPFGPTWSLDLPDRWAHAAFRTFFSSLFCGGLAVIAPAILFRRRERGGRFALALAVGSLAACVLPWFLPAAWGSRLSPIPLRYPEKFAVGAVFALAVAAGLATDALREGGRRPRASIAVALALAAVAVAGHFAPGAVGRAGAGALGLPAAHAADAGRQISSAFAEAGLLWAATVIAIDLLGRPARWALPAALALLAAIPVLANRRIARTFPEESLFRPTAFARLAQKRDPQGRFRSLDASRYRAPSPLDGAAQAVDSVGNDFYRRSWFLYTPCLFRRAMVLNADPDVGDFSRIESLRRLSGLFPWSSHGHAVLSSLSLRYAVRFRDQEALPGFQVIREGGLQSFDENSGALPDIRLASSWRETPSALGALEALSDLAPGEVVVETGRSARGASAGGSVERIEDRPERLRFAVSAARPAWVFVLRGFWPYRTVSIDGNPVEPVPAQLAFSAIPVPAGRHEVEWRENVPGSGVSWVGPALGLLGAILLWRRDRPEAAKESA